MPPQPAEPDHVQHMLARFAHSSELAELRREGLETRLAEALRLEEQLRDPAGIPADLLEVVERSLDDWLRQRMTALEPLEGEALLEALPQAAAIGDEILAGSLEERARHLETLAVFLRGTAALARARQLTAGRMADAA
jgi:hypothetical protein